MNYSMEILRELREDRGLKQSDIANLIGTTQQQYSKYETNETELSLRVLIILADYYNLSIDYIIGRTKCREGIEILDKELINGISIGKFMSDIYSLSDTGQRFIIDCLDLIRFKENNTKVK